MFCALFVAYASILLATRYVCFLVEEVIHRRITEQLRQANATSRVAPVWGGFFYSIASLVEATAVSGSSFTNTLSPKRKSMY